MKNTRSLFFLALIALSAADFSGITSTQANTATTLTLTGGTVLDTVLAGAFGGSVANGLSFSVTTDQAVQTLSVSLSLSATTYASANIAGGSGNIASASLLAGLTSAVSLTISTGSVNTKVTITITTPAISLSTSSNIQVALLAAFPDATASASGNVYGATAFSVSGTKTTYVIPAGFSNQLFFLPLDTSASTSASSSASSSSSSSNSNYAGSTSFNYNGKFIPVSYNSDYSLVVGQQYAYGSNIVVSPISTSANGSSAGTLNIAYVGNFNSSARSSAPNAAAYYNGYYQISGSSSANNVIQWSADTSNTGAIFVKNGAQVTAQQFGTTYASTATWYKSTTASGSAAASSSWSSVSSYRGVTATGRVSVYANVNSYSQWTVGSTSSTTKAAYLLVVIAAAVALLF